MRIKYPLLTKKFRVRFMDKNFWGVKFCFVNPKVGKNKTWSVKKKQNHSGIYGQPNFRKTKVWHHRMNYI